MRVLVPLFLVALAGCRPEPGAATLSVDRSQAGHVISPHLFGDQMETMEQQYFWDEAAHAPFPGVMEAAKASGISLIRYPGGAPSDHFHWAESIGPVDQRVPQYDPYTSTPEKEERRVVLLGPDEIVDVANDMGAELMITVNVGTGTPEEAVAWLRHYKAKGVLPKYWEIGNEIWIQSAVLKPPAEYAALFDSFASALRAEEPGIQLGILGCHDSGAFNLCADAKWNEVVLSTVKEKFDFMAVHNVYAPAIAETYSSPENERIYKALLAAPDGFAHNFQLHQEDLEKHAAAHNKAAAIAVTEHASYFVPFPDTTVAKQMERNRTLAAALFSGATMNVLFENPRVTVANHLKISSPYWQAVANPSPYDMNNVAKSAWFHVFRLYADAAGGTFVPVEIETDATFDSEKVGIVPAYQGVKALHATAVIPAGAPDELWLYVINRDLGRDIVANLSLANVSAGTVSVDVVNGDGWYAFNSEHHPEAVRVTTTDGVDPEAITFAAHSLTRVRIQP